MPRHSVRSALLVVLVAGLGCAAVTSAVLQARSPDPSAGRTLSWQIPPENPDTPSLRFLVVGDWGTGGRGQRAVANAMVARAGRIPVDLVLMTGDNFYPDGVSSVDDPQWHHAFERMYLRGVLANVPFFPVLGNHDYRGNPQAQLEYAKTHPAWVMPARYHVVTRELADGTRLDVFALDTTPLSLRSPGHEAQMAWLKNALSTLTAHWRVVMGHHPIYSSGPHGNSVVMRDLLEDLLVTHGVQVYFTGHDHHLEVARPVRGVHHVVSGAGAGLDRPYPVDWTDKTIYVATRGGFVAARLDQQQLVLEFVRPDANTQFAYVVARCLPGNQNASCPKVQGQEAQVLP